MPTPTPTRRTVLKLLSAGAVAAGYNVVTGSWVGAAAARPATGLRFVPDLDGTLHLDPATLAAYANDYGQVVHETPVAVLEPGSTRDIRRMLQFARLNRIRVAARGQGHLPFGQAQVSGGLVIDMRTRNAVHEIGPDWVEVDAGITWLDLLTATLERGLTPPVLTSSLHLTVGGTLSVGGISPLTDRRGAQVDSIDELEVIPANGLPLRCSVHRRRDLFEAALAGQGQCGIISRARVRLVPAPEQVRQFFLVYPDLATLLGDAERVAGDRRFDEVTGLLFPQGDQLVPALFCARHFTPPDQPDTAALLAGLQFVPGTEQFGDLPFFDHVNAVPPLTFTAARPDLSVFVPTAHARGFLDTIVPRLTADDLGAVATVQLFFWPTVPPARPLLRLPAGGCILFGILRVPTTDQAELDTALAGNRVIFEHARAAGGTLYPFTALGLSSEDWERHYGEAFGALSSAKLRYDPHNLFASGPDIF